MCDEPATSAIGHKLCQNGHLKGYTLSILVGTSCNIDRWRIWLVVVCVCVWKGTNGKYTSTLMIPICFIPWHTESSARRTGDKCNRSQLVSERSSTFYTLNMVCTEEEFSHFQYAVHNCRHVNITKHNTEYTNTLKKLTNINLIAILE